MAPTVHQQFSASLDVLVEQIKQDRSILAAVLCGSLSHDTVWAKSDIDLVLVTIDDKIPCEGLALWADGINVHAILMTRTKFRESVEGAIGNSFGHSFLAKGRLLYTHDETIAELCSRLQVIGERDIEVQLLNAGCAAVLPIYKAHKWFLTRKDLEYTAVWILYAATPLAKIEVLSAGQVVDREAIPQAMKLNPEFFGTVYTELLNAKKTVKAVQSALTGVDEYFAARAPVLFGPVIEHLREVGEARSATEIEHHFQRNFGVHGVTTACEYLADQKLIGKAPLPVRLTKRSSVAVEEIAFFHAANTTNP